MTLIVHDRQQIHVHGMFWDMCNYNYKSCDISYRPNSFSNIYVLLLSNIYGTKYNL